MTNARVVETASMLVARPSMSRGAKGRQGQRPRSRALLRAHRKLPCTGCGPCLQSCAPVAIVPVDMLAMPIKVVKKAKERLRKNFPIM
jgi:ferredoxin